MVNGYGIFTNAITVGDFNGDGNVDLAVIVDTPSTNVSEIAVLLGNGNGTFGPTNYFPNFNSAFGEGSMNLQAADLAFNGHLDLVATNVVDLISSVGNNGTSSLVTDNVSALPGLGDGTFGFQQIFWRQPTRNSRKRVGWR